LPHLHSGNYREAKKDDGSLQWQPVAIANLEAMLNSRRTSAGRPTTSACAATWARAAE
jgi:hypothetical protein